MELLLLVPCLMSTPAAEARLNSAAPERIAVTIDPMSPDYRTAGSWPSARAVPDKPVLDGIEENWSQRWEQARVVQV
jgi:hypothetical protein